MESLELGDLFNSFLLNSENSEPKSMLLGALSHQLDDYRSAVFESFVVILSVFDWQLRVSSV